MDNSNEPRPSAAKPMLVMAALLIVSIALLVQIVQGLLNPPQAQRVEGPTPSYRVQGPRVTLFATSWCGYCAKAREFFQSNDIAYLDLDIEKNADAEAEHEAIGGRGVPVIVVDGHVLHGWSESETIQQLQIAGLLK